MVLLYADKQYDTKSKRYQELNKIRKGSRLINLITLIAVVKLFGALTLGSSWHYLTTMHTLLVYGAMYESQAGCNYFLCFSVDFLPMKCFCMFLCPLKKRFRQSRHLLDVQRTRCHGHNQFFTF